MKQPTLTELVARVEALEGKPVVLDDLPLAALQRKLELDWQPNLGVLIGPGAITLDMLAESTLGSAVAGSFGGPWPTAAPGPTDGAVFTMPTQGRLTMVAWASAFASFGGLGQVEVYIDQILCGTMKLFFNTTVEHLLLVPVGFQTQTLAAGPHHIYFRMTAGATDANDSGGYLGLVTP